MSHIIDRRLNQGQKNLGNRQRFIRRARDQIKKSMRERLDKRSIGDTVNGEQVKIPIDTVREPSFGHDAQSGTQRRVLPGNKDYVPGDHIDRPDQGSSGGGSGSGSGASNSDQTHEDEFEFTLSRQEFYDLFFEDLELPDLVRKQLRTQDRWEMRRHGISTAGNHSNLNVIRTLRQSLGRRLVLRKPHEQQIIELEHELMLLAEHDPRRTDILQQLELLRKKVISVPYVDPVDLRFNVFERKPLPSTTAVMFCVMDVSGSMDEHKKDMAKRFFMLLYLFLQKKYEKVVLEFIRHHTEAEQVSEQVFFYDRLSGGTQVSSALRLTCDIIKKSYDPAAYNIYVCQASDGDNYMSDNTVCEQILREELLPQVQYMAYVEISDPRDIAEYPLLQYAHSSLHQTYSKVAQSNPRLQTAHVWQVNEIYKVFRELFERK